MHTGRQACQLIVEEEQVGNSDLWPPQQLLEGGSVLQFRQAEPGDRGSIRGDDPDLTQPLAAGIDLLQLGRVLIPTFIIDQAGCSADPGQTLIGVILA